MANSIIREKIHYIYGKLFFGLIACCPRIGYRVYVPDSIYAFGKYPESKMLYHRWIRNSRVNDGGDLNRFYSLILNLQQLLDEGVKGEFAELGVYQGTTAAVIAHFAEKGSRKLFLFDTFNGFDRRDLVDIDAPETSDFSDTSHAGVSAFIGHQDICRYCVGYFPESLTSEAEKSSFAFVHLDCDLYKPMSDGLRFFWPRLSSGGMFFLHDYSSGHWKGAKKAIDEFCQETGNQITLLPDKSGTALIRKPRLISASKSRENEI